MADIGIKISPLFYVFKSGKDFDAFFAHHELLGPVILHDTIKDQLFELVRTKNPKERFLANQKEELLESFYPGIDYISYGVWVFYPWNRHLVHLLPEEEFVFLRTNRNQFKITPAEQAELATKKVGIIGLSVGQSVALTMAMERSAGEFHLADFDSLDLSNLNRIRSKVFQLGVSKALICAREILEIDPFLKVYIYENGIDENNIDRFLRPESKLDLLVEECDGLDIKILARYKARDFQIPVVMETSDRGLLDIERFDLDPNLPILHGLIGDLDPAKLKGLSQEDKIEYLLPMVGLSALSERMKASMLEVQNSIVSWPQLASAVTMGGGVAAEMGRKILLNQSSQSGRYYIDLDILVPEPKPKVLEKATYTAPLTAQEIESILALVRTEKTDDIVSDEDKIQIYKAAISAPSGGNCQPWRIGFYQGFLYLIHDPYYSESFLDFQHMGTYIGFGAMVENISIQAEALGLTTKAHFFPVQGNKQLVAQIQFNKNPILLPDPKVNALFERVTNRKIGARHLLSEGEKEVLMQVAKEEKVMQLTLVEDSDALQNLGDILATAEMYLMLHPIGHQDIFTKELRFTQEQVMQTRDGLDIETLNVSKAEKLALRIANNRSAMDILRKIGGGEAFKKTTKNAVNASAALGIISMPFYSPESFIHAGSFLQKIWLSATLQNLSVQPATQFSFLLNRYKHGKGEGFDSDYKDKFAQLESRFSELLPQLSQQEIAFVFRISKEASPEIRSLRRFPEQIIFNVS